MHTSVVNLPNCGLRSPIFSDSVKSKLGKSRFSHLEIADGSPVFASRRVLLQLTVSSIKSDGNGRDRRPQRNSVPGRTAKENGDKIPQSSDGKSSSKSYDQEEIVALFRRIQSSILKEGSANTKRRSSKKSKENQSVESVLDILRQSRKPVKNEVLSKEEDKLSSRRRIAPKKEQRIQDSPHRADFELTRPPSNFMKRSPIPSPRGKASEVSKETSPPATDGRNELDLHRIEEMKLPELKEVAKSRGIKGYSKLRKGELMELLKGSVKS